MTAYILGAITVAITLLSYFVKFPMETWVPFSIATYIVMAIAFSVATVIKTRKLKKANAKIIYDLYGVWDKIDVGFGLVMVIFVWYVLISMISYFRLLDFVIHDGPSAWVMTIIACFAFASLLIIGSKRKSKIKNKS